MYKNLAIFFIEKYSMGLDDTNGPYSDSNLDPDFRDDSSPGSLGDMGIYLEEIINNAEVRYYSEDKFDLTLDWWNENTPTFEEMEEYFSQIIKEKYNWTYIRNESDYRYRLELPFDNFLSEVPEEVFRKQRDIQKHTREKETKKRKEGKNHSEKLKNVWFQKTRSHTDEDNSWYEKRLLDVLDNNNLPNIPAIASQTMDIAKLNKNPDFYEKNLLERLEKYEKEVENTYIIDESISELAKIFSSWHIDNPNLFLRFEKLKIDNLIYLQRRIYYFWLKDVAKDGAVYSHFKTNDTWKQSEYLEDKEVEIISHFFKYWGFWFDKVDINKEEFTEKLKKWFIAERIRTRIQWRRFGTKYNWFYNKNLENAFGIWQNILNQWYDEAKKKFMVQYPSLIETQTFDNISVLVRLISDNWNNILKWKALFPDLNFDENKEKEKIIFWLENCIRQWVEKLKNKEKIKKCKREDRKHLNYKEQLAVMIDQIDKLYIELKKIEPQTDDSQRQSQKESYKNEYIDFHRNTFIENRISSVLKVDINDEDKLKEQVINDVSIYFEKICKKEIEKKATHPITYNPLTNRKVINFLTEAFFRTWHSLLLKTKYPDDKERKLLRQELTQKIIKNILEQTEEQLTKWDFSEISNCLIEPLTYLYKKYDWKEKNLIKNPDLIKENYIKNLRTQLEKDINVSIEKMANEINKPTNRGQIKSTYIAINDVIAYVSKYMSLFLQWYHKELDKKRETEMHKNWISKMTFLEENLEYNEKADNKYPKWYMQKLALWGYDIQDIEKLLDPEVQERFIYMFQHIDTTNPQICEKIVEQRLLENWQSWWKLQRIVQEAIIKEFWLTPIWPEQIEYLMNYLSENLENIFFKDLQIEIIKDFNPFRNNKDLLKKMLLDLLNNFKQNVALWQWENMKMLWF